VAVKVIIDVTSATRKKRVFSYEDHDTFVVGRMNDCHVCIEDDGYLSRQHFILEVNPPNARLQDLGSLNGTYVNGKKYGGRDITESPEEAKAKYKFPWIDLKNGDVIKTGDTQFNIIVQAPDRSAVAVKCQKCGRDASSEIGAAGGGSYICENCQKKAEASPFELLQQFMDESKSIRSLVNKSSSFPLQKRGFQTEIPFQIADYDVVKVLGAGIYGAAYLLKHRSNGSEAALKLMMPKTSASSDLQDRFLEETITANSLRHTNSVEFYESGCRNGIFYFLMEYCNFGNMDALRRKGKIPLTETILSTLQVLEVLTFAHSQGLIHRDIKPQNILLKKSAGGLTAKLSDFGLTKSFILTGLSGMTVAGGNAVSYPYMPREQVVDFKYAKPETDIWSLGATIYNLLTGEFPRDFTYGKDPLEVILHGEIIPIQTRDSSIPKEIADVVNRAVQNNPADRYQHAGEMLSAIKRVWKRKI
jgi:hypothetical protein